MTPPALKIAILGLSITSSWGNGHATTYRGLVKGLSARGHEVLFLERDQDWYASNRDLPKPPYGETGLYASIADLKQRFGPRLRQADLVMIGSYVPDGAAIGHWITSRVQGITAFYDIDTPITLAGLAHGNLDYLSRDLIARYHLYLSFTGGPTLQRIEREFGSPKARALYCSVDPKLYYPEDHARKWELGYLGTYSADRQPVLDALLLEPARQSGRRFVVAGPQYPDAIAWPANVERIIHLSPRQHRRFYARQRFTLNVTRQEMVKAGFSPSVRLFEAAACATPIISDSWPGLESLFVPGEEILIAQSAADTLRYLCELPEPDRCRIAQRARQRVLNGHTAAHRAAELEGHILETLNTRG